MNLKDKIKTMFKRKDKENEIIDVEEKEVEKELIKEPLIKEKLSDKVKNDEGNQIEEKEVEQKEVLIEQKEIEEKAEEDEEEKINVLDILKDEEKSLDLVDINSQEYSKIIRENINFCTSEIKEISVNMDLIEQQKGSESFWKKSENIKIISKYVSRITSVQQKTLDLLVLLLGASGKMVNDYDTIMATIDELGELNNGEAEVLNYLLKVKKMINEIKDNDKRLKDIINNSKALTIKVVEFEKELQIISQHNVKVMEVVEKKFLMEKSKNKRLEAKINRNAFYVLMSFVVTIVAVILFYFWLR